MHQAIRLLPLCLLLFAVNTKTSAQNLSFGSDKTFSGIIDSLELKVQNWANKFIEVNSEKEFGQLVPFRKDLEHFIDTNITRVLLIKDQVHSQLLCIAVLNLLIYEKSMISKGYILFEKLTTNSTNEQINAAFKNLERLSEGESALMIKIADAQKQFAQSNQIILTGTDSTGTNK